MARSSKTSQKKAPSTRKTRGAHKENIPPPVGEAATLVTTNASKDSDTMNVDQPDGPRVSTPSF